MNDTPQAHTTATAIATSTAMAEEEKRCFNRLTVIPDAMFLPLFIFTRAFCTFHCVRAFGKKVRKKTQKQNYSSNFYFKIIFHFRTSSCFSDFFEILRLKKVVVCLFLYYLLLSSTVKKTRKICVRFHVVLRLSIVSFVTAKMCFKRICG